MHVVVDTNVLISAALSAHGNPARIFQLWHDGDVFVPLVSVPILDEYRRALRYKGVKARHRLTEEEMTTLVEDLAASATLVDPEEPLQVVEDDPNDNKFLECGVAGGADYIVSGDDHLLRLREYRGIRILSPAAFVAMLDDQGGEDV